MFTCDIREKQTCCACVSSQSSYNYESLRGVEVLLIDQGRSCLLDSLRNHSGFLYLLKHIFILNIVRPQLRGVISAGTGTYIWARLKLSCIETGNSIFVSTASAVDDFCRLYWLCLSDTMKN